MIQSTRPSLHIFPQEVQRLYAKIIARTRRETLGTTLMYIHVHTIIDLYLDVQKQLILPIKRLQHIFPFQKCHTHIAICISSTLFLYLLFPNMLNSEMHQIFLVSTDTTSCQAEHTFHFPVQLRMLLNYVYSCYMQDNVPHPLCLFCVNHHC